MFVEFRKQSNECRKKLLHLFMELLHFMVVFIVASSKTSIFEMFN